MEISWMVVAAKVSLYAFCLFVGASLVAIAWLRSNPGAGERPGPSTTLLARLLEYAGNIDAAGPGGARPERRRNPQARALMEHIIQEMAARQAPPRESEEVIEELRESIRSVEPEQTG
jgi:hypothetical protein